MASIRFLWYDSYHILHETKHGGMVPSEHVRCSATFMSTRSLWSWCLVLTIVNWKKNFQIWLDFSGGPSGRVRRNSVTRSAFWLIFTPEILEFLLRASPGGIEKPPVSLICEISLDLQGSNTRIRFCQISLDLQGSNNDSQTSKATIQLQGRYFCHSDLLSCSRN